MRLLWDLGKALATYLLLVVGGTDLSMVLIVVGRHTAYGDITASPYESFLWSHLEILAPIQETYREAIPFAAGLASVVFLLTRFLAMFRVPPPVIGLIGALSAGFLTGGLVLLIGRAVTNYLYVGPVDPWPVLVAGYLAILWSGWLPATSGFLRRSPDPPSASG